MNSKRNLFSMLLLMAIFLPCITQIYALGTQTQFWDSNIQVDVTHPATVTKEGKFIVSGVLKGKTADNVNATLSITPSAAFKVVGDSIFYIPELKQDSTLGFTFELVVSSDAAEGIHTVNLFVNYKHKELLGDYTTRSFSKAIEIQLQSMPDIVYSIRAPDSLFVGDKFPVTIELQNSGFNAHDVKLNIIPPSDLKVVGQNIHTLSKLEAGAKSAVEFELEVPEGIDKAEKKLLQVKVSYSDDAGNNHESTETFPLLVRPRGFLEIGPAGGVWMGPFFISLIVGVGSIVSTTIGVIIFAYHLKQRRVKRDKVSKKNRNK